MGISTTSNNRIFVKIHKEKDDAVNEFRGRSCFCIQEKVGDSWETTTRGDTMSGRLIGIEHGSYEHEGNKIVTFSMDVEDPDSDKVMRVSGNMSFMTRSMLNNLASIEGPGDIMIRIYNKDGYDKMYIEYNGERLDWKWDPREDPDLIPKVERVSIGNKEVLDDSKVNDWFVQMIERHLKPMFKDVKPSEKSAPAADWEEPTAEEKPADKNATTEEVVDEINSAAPEGGKDLPF